MPNDFSTCNSENQMLIHNPLQMILSMSHVNEFETFKTTKSFFLKNIPNLLLSMYTSNCFFLFSFEKVSHIFGFVSLHFCKDAQTIII